jgi:hypothetical protein
MDLELLTVSPINSVDLNDDLFGRLLDRIHECGCEPLFYELAMTVRMALNLPENYVYIQIRHHTFCMEIIHRMKKMRILLSG